LQTFNPIQPEAPIALTALHELEDAGGHSEALSIPHQQALRALMQDHLVRRVAYKAGLVIYEITKAGRRISAAYPRSE
jgi:hypothetical protein